MYSGWHGTQVYQAFRKRNAGLCFGEINSQPSDPQFMTYGYGISTGTGNGL